MTQVSGEIYDGRQPDAIYQRKHMFTVWTLFVIELANPDMLL